MQRHGLIAHVLADPPATQLDDRCGEAQTGDQFDYRSLVRLRMVAEERKAWASDVPREVWPLQCDARIETWNQNPHPYIWTKAADQILESIARYCERINASGH